MSRGVYDPTDGEGLSPDSPSRKELISSEREEQCKLLVKDLFKPKNDFIAETWVKNFEVFAARDERIYYSVISIQIYELSLENEESSDFFRENLELAYQNISDEYKKILLKFFDHINLCIQQVDLVSRVDGVKKDAFQRKLNKELDEAKKEIALQKEDLKKMAEKTKNVQREYVAVLGIFTAVICSGLDLVVQ